MPTCCSLAEAAAAADMGWVAGWAGAGWAEGWAEGGLVAAGDCSMAAAAPCLSSSARRTGWVVAGLVAGSVVADCAADWVVAGLAAAMGAAGWAALDWAADSEAAGLVEAGQRCRSGSIADRWIRHMAQRRHLACNCRRRLSGTASDPQQKCR